MATAGEIITACQNALATASGDCNLFVKTVENLIGLADFGPADNADRILLMLETSPGSWTSLADGIAAKNAADAGNFVIGGLKSGNFIPPHANGHVVVIVSGPLDASGRYPTAYWGNLGGVPSLPNGQTVNFAFAAVDRDNVEYFSRN